MKRQLFALLLLLTSISCCVSALAASGPLFVPQPREWRPGGTLPFNVARIVVPGRDPEDAFAALNVRTALIENGIRITSEPAYTISLLRSGTPEASVALRHAGLTFDAAMNDEGYIIIAKRSGTTVIARNASGIFYGTQTFEQMILPSHVLALGTIRDWPAMRWRGVDDDLSRGPVPALAFQKHQLDVLASYKVNIYSPYLESTLEYKDNLMVPPPGSALTPADVAELVAYAKERHIIIVPEQEAFGHLHHVLEFDRYADVAETPHGNVLAPGQPGTLPLIKDWFTQIAAEFPGPFLHVGADETFDLGTGRTRQEVKSRGLGDVYADFLTQIHTELAPLHRRLLFWGDIAWNDKQAVARLPKDMIAVPWIYWHEDNYDSNIVPFRDAGIETWVAPGDANWNVVYPIAATVLDNVSGFVEAGQRLGSTGELMTVWNDDGEGLFNEDWFGVLFGAAAAWQPARITAAPYEQAFGLRFYNDPSGRIDEAQQKLMIAQKLINTSDENFWIDPWSAEGQRFLAINRSKLLPARVAAERALELLAEVEHDTPELRERNALQAMELGARRIDFLAQKFEWSDDMASAYAKAYALRNDKARSVEARESLYSMSSMNGRCQDLRDGYSLLKTLYAQTWLAENRPYWLENVTVRYDLRIQLWQQRGERINDVINHWQQTGELPTAAELGLPGVATDDTAAQPDGRK